MTANKEKILIIDDEAEMLDNCCRILERTGYDCQPLQESENFAKIFKEEQSCEWGQTLIISIN